MTMLRRFTVAAVASAALTGGVSAGALAADPFGEHVALCARQLGPLGGAPAATCTHDDMTMTFPNFGAMVEHMRAMR